MQKGAGVQNNDHIRFYCHYNSWDKKIFLKKESVERSGQKNKQLFDMGRTNRESCR
jgi:hypothetical protein